MNSKKLTVARNIPQPFNRQAGSVRQFKPAVAQLKTPVSAQSIKRPVAPPVYRPQPTPKVAQRKMATDAVNRKLPIAPHVYRPQAVPKVLQTKSSLSPRPNALPNSASRVAPPLSSKAGLGGQVIQRAAEESKSLKKLGSMWAEIAELPPKSKKKKEFFKHAGEIEEKLGFKIYTVFHKHDPYVGGGKNKSYVKIVKALQGKDAGKSAAAQYVAWAEGESSIVDLPRDLQELAIIVHVAEVGRLYSDAPDKLLAFMEQVSKANAAQRAILWKNFKEHNEFAFTAKEDGEYVPMSDDDDEDDDE